MNVECQTSSSGENTPSGKMVLSSISATELKMMVNRLLIFARRRYFGRLDYEDIVSEALIQVWSGKRALNLDYTLFKNLVLIVRSVASNELLKETRYVSVDDIPKSTLGDLTTRQQRQTYISNPAEIYEQRLYAK